jgi:flagellar hook assembly protein FlgD
VLDNDTNLRPGSFDVDAIYPNPFNPGTTIHYNVENSSLLSVSILDLQGRTVSTLARDKEHHTGSYALYWDGLDANGEHLSSGVYLVRIHSGFLSQVHKIVMLH